MDGTTIVGCDGYRYIVVQVPDCVLTADWQGNNSIWLGGVQKNRDEAFLYVSLNVTSLVKGLGVLC